MGRVFLWVGGVFTAIGLVFVAVAGWVYLDDRSFAAGGVQAQGTVIDMVGSGGSDGYTYSPVVEFRDAYGRRHVFTSSVSSNPPRYARGEEVAVIYTPDSPNEAVIDGFVDRFLLPLIFGALGTLFAAIGFGLLVFWLRARRIAEQLRAGGLPIQARVVECYRDTSVRVNGRSPWRAVAQATHPADGKVHSFKSGPVWSDPGPVLAGKEVRVFVDPARPGRHLVDLSPYFGDDELG